MFRRMGVLTGLDGIDWSALRHAYGPAHEVPDLLRGLASDDPEVREVALDGLYGAVLHQGSVYDSTLAAVPFLLRLASADGPGRAAAVEFLAAVAGSCAEREPGVVVAAGPVFLDALAHPDPAVRTAACTGVVACRPEGAARALSARLALEPDVDVRIAVVDALRALSEVDELVAVAGGGDRPAVRLTALAGVADLDPDRLPDDVVAAAGELVRRVYAEGTSAPEPAGFSTDTLVGHIREHEEAAARGRRAARAMPLLAGLSRALGDRVADRARLLRPLLTADDWEVRLDAVRVAGQAVSGWRGDHTELVRLIGDQLLAPEPRLPRAAADALRYLDLVAAPAADALARSVERSPRAAPPDTLAWVVEWPAGGSSVGTALAALAALGDARALPALTWALERPVPPADIGHALRGPAAGAASLVPLIRRRLADLPVPEGHDRHRSGLFAALGAMGGDAVPAVPDLVAHLPDALPAVTTLGPHASAAVPALHVLLDDPEHEVPAAFALWRVTGAADRVLPVLLRHVEDTRALEALAEIGRPETAPALRPLLDHDRGWVRLGAAVALWRATGDVAGALPVLREVWEENRHTRAGIARAVARMGPAAAALAPLLRAEVARPDRLGSSTGGVWSSDGVRADEELRRECRAALTALG
nr:hypothetical protein GCM10017745_66280 [Saccharothrix mutabilis subsp. capreolus]